MAVIAKSEREIKVDSILISQPEPTNGKSPYYDIAEKFNIKVDFRQFIQIEEITPKEFRKERIDPTKFSAVIFTSKVVIKHFFRVSKEMRFTMPADTKYFCASEAIALYLQKFIEYRKRKVFYPKDKKHTIFSLLEKHKNKENFLFPCASYPFDDVRKMDIPDFLKEKEFDFAEVVIYRIVCSDLSDLEEIYYDVIVFFAPLGIKSLFKNFPAFKQKKTRIAALGNATAKAVDDHQLTLDIAAPIPGIPSMKAAIEHYLKKVNDI